MTEEQRRAAEKLAALGYAGGVRSAAESPSGVTVHDSERAFQGLNFYTSGHAPEALLVDMDGVVRHRWKHAYTLDWPDLEVPEKAAGRSKWRRAHLYPNGDILAIHEGIAMIKLDRDSNLLWEYPGYAHHDMHVMEDGTIWTLTRLPLMIPRIDPDLPSLDDYIVKLDPRGKELEKLSLLESLENGGCHELLERVKHRDMFHTNSIEILDGRLAAEIPELAAGNVLISIRHLNAVAVVDMAQEKVVWWMDGEFAWQHDAQILPNRHLLLFDNRGLNRGERKASRILELDPTTREILWQYRGTKKLPFYSHTSGSAYRLPNGNTLINESDGGRSFEVTAAGEIVWELFNPFRTGPENGLVACFYDLQRFAPESMFSWLPPVEAHPDP